MFKKALWPIFSLLIFFTLSGCSVSFKNNKNEIVPENNNIATTTETVTDILATTTAPAVTDEKLLDLTIDSDKDGLTNLQEVGYQTNISNSDSDGDGFNDGDEVKSGYNPAGPGKLYTVTENCSDKKSSELDDCYREISLNKQDESLCQPIKDENDRVACILLVIARKGDRQICEFIAADYQFMYHKCYTELQDEMTPKDIIYSKDSRTLADIKQIQTALELYYNDAGKYPEVVKSGAALSYKGNTYMNILPSGTRGSTLACDNNYSYIYTFISPNDYTLSYCLDGIGAMSEQFGSGPKIAYPGGIDKFGKTKLTKPGYTNLNETEVSRDSKVVSDVKEIQTSLELYYNDSNAYPETVKAGTAISFGSSVYLKTFPAEVVGKSPACLNHNEYKYVLVNSREYNLSYCLDDEYQSIKPGLNIATPQGIATYK